MKLLLWGSGGHGKVVLDIARAVGRYPEICFLDDTAEKQGQSFRGCPVRDPAALRSPGARRGGEDECFLISIGDNRTRSARFAEASAAGLAPATLIHPSAVISPSASIGAGTVVMPGAVINADARVGRNSIVNTGAVVEHDCMVGDHAHIAPQAVLGGAVQVGDFALVGAGAQARPGAVIGANAIVGAGAVVLDEVPASATVAGVPARIVRGGAPAPVKDRILLSVPHMSGREQQYIAAAFASNWLSTVGPNLDAFESEFQTRLGLPAVAVSSGTAAIHLGLRALGVSPGDTVFCSDLTFVASVNPVRYLGAEPVLIDSEPRTWNMDPRLLARALADRAACGRLPKAVIVVHLFGQCADMDPILETCARYRVPVLEDAAEALGATYKGRPAGTLGDAAIFSFNGNKIITTTGGGMLVSRRPEIVARARFWATQARDPGLAYEHSEMGYNYRLSNVLAGIGRAQLQVLDVRVAQRRAIAARYFTAFAGLPGIVPMPQASAGLHTNWLSCFLIDQAAFGCSRDGLIARLAEAGIESRPVWKPMHLQPLYAASECYGGAVSEDLFRRGICLPSSSSLTAEDQDAVIRQVRHAALSGQLAALGENVGQASACRGTSVPHSPLPALIAGR